MKNYFSSCLQFINQQIKSCGYLYFPHIVWGMLIFFWGVLICLHYGRIGFMPLDQSIVFDGAWRLLCHQLPGRDFLIPYGLMPISLQALFFKIFGINWFSYCLHAAIFNGLFSIIVYLILISFGCPSLLAFFYALLSAIIFYPPFGVPYMDQHSWFFSLMALYAAILISKSPHLTNKIFLTCLSSIFLLAGFFSKPIPAGFFFSLCLLTMLVGLPKTTWKYLLSCFFICSIFVLLLVMITFWHLGFKPRRFVADLLLNPLIFGKERLDFLKSYYSFNKLSSALFYPKPFEPLSLKLYSYFLIYLAFAFFSVKIFFLIFKSKTSPFPLIRNHRDLFLMAILSLFLLISSNLFIFTTLNQGENGLPILFLSLGLIHLTTLKLYYLAEKPSFYKKSNFSLAKIFISLIFISIALLDGLTFNFKVNRTRIVHDMIIDQKNVSMTKPDFPDLKFMNFVTPSKYRFSAHALKNLVEYLKKQKANFFLLGDSSIIYGLTRRPSPNPSLWFHPGLTLPFHETPAFDEYEKKLLMNLKKYRCQFLVIEGEVTWFNLYLACFKKLPALIKGNATLNKKFGSFLIYPIDLKKIDSLLVSY